MNLFKKLFDSAPHWREHRQALSNFTYKKDIKNEHRRFLTITEPFYGDCEDYAFTLQILLGGKVMYCRTKDNIGHAVLVKDGWVYDNMYKHGYRVEDSPHEMTDFSLTFRGETIDNRRV